METFSKAAKAFKMAHVSSAEPFIMAMGSLECQQIARMISNMLMDSILKVFIALLRFSASFLIPQVVSRCPRVAQRPWIVEITLRIPRGRWQSCFLQVRMPVGSKSTLYQELSAAKLLCSSLVVLKEGSQKTWVISKTLSSKRMDQQRLYIII